MNFESLLKCKVGINQRRRAQRVDEKKKSPFVELSCFLPELWFLKCQKWRFFVFSAVGSKKICQTLRIT